MSPWYSARCYRHGTAISIYPRAEDQLSVLVQAGDPGGRRDQHSPGVHMHRPAVGKLGTPSALRLSPSRPSNRIRKARRQDHMEDTSATQNGVAVAIRDLVNNASLATTAESSTPGSASRTSSRDGAVWALKR